MADHLPPLDSEPRGDEDPAITARVTRLEVVVEEVIARLDRFEQRTEANFRQQAAEFQSLRTLIEDHSREWRALREQDNRQWRAELRVLDEKWQAELRVLDEKWQAELRARDEKWQAERKADNEKWQAALREIEARRKEDNEKWQALIDSKSEKWRDALNADRTRQMNFLLGLLTAFLAGVLGLMGRMLHLY